VKRTFHTRQQLDEDVSNDAQDEPFDEGIRTDGPLSDTDTPFVKGKERQVDEGGDGDNHGQSKAGERAKSQHGDHHGVQLAFS